MSSGWRSVWPGRQRHDSGIPVETDADFVFTALQPLLALAFTCVCLATVRPMGTSGWGLVGLLLVLSNGALMFPRTLFEERIGLRGRLVAALVAAPLAGLAWAFDPYSFAECYAIALVVHAGVRFEARVAASVTALCAGVAMVALAVQQGADVPPFYVGAGMVLALPFGMLRRGRRRQLATANALVEQTRKAAAGEARAELARDLHDVLAHSLSGVNMQLSMADALLEAGRLDQGRDALARARAMVVDGLGEARRAVSVLRAGTVDVAATVGAMLTAEHERFVLVGAPGPLQDLVEQTLVRVAQESITNARRHAPEAPLTVTLDLGYGEHGDAGGVRDGVRGLRLEVVNGPGRAPDIAGGGGMGLIGMRERAASIGATLTAGPVTGGPFTGGWRVELRRSGKDGVA